MSVTRCTKTIVYGTWVRSMVVEGVQQRVVWTERRRMVDLLRLWQNSRRSKESRRDNLGEGHCRRVASFVNIFFNYLRFITWSLSKVFNNLFVRWFTWNLECSDRYVMEHVFLFLNFLRNVACEIFYLFTSSLGPNCSIWTVWFKVPHLVACNSQIRVIGDTNISCLSC